MNATKYGIAKLYVCISMLVTVYQLVQVPETPGAMFAICVSMILVVAGLVDAIVNDFMPRRYFAKAVHDHRYAVFLLLAGGQMSLIYRDVVTQSLGWETIRYITDALVASTVALLSFRARYRWVTRDHSKFIPDQAA